MSSSWPARRASARPSLVAAVCGALRRTRALGRVRPADHAARDGPAARRRPPGRRAAARGARRAARARPSSTPRSTSSRRAAVARHRGPPLGRRRHARPRRAPRPPARALARLPDPHLPQRGRRGAARGPARARRAAARVRARIEPGPLSQDAVALLAARAGRDAVGPARGLGRQPVLRHRGRSPRPPAAASRRASATPSPCA